MNSTQPLRVRPTTLPFLASIAFVVSSGCADTRGERNGVDSLATTASSSFVSYDAKADASHPWDEPALDRVTSIRDGRTGAIVTYAEMTEALARADAVFLGESHTDETTHRVELAVYENLLARRDGKLVLAMEMFERDSQGALDAYLRGEIDEATFSTRAHVWSNYRTAYRRLVEHAKAHHAPVVASNFPAALRRKANDEASIAALSPEERAWAPAELHANTPAYWRRVDNAIRGHSAMMGPKAAADDPRLYDTQSMWDNTMGESCALALDRHPGFGVLHVNGGFHTEYWDGTARQFALRKPKAKLLTVAIVTSSSPFAADTGGLPMADFVVFAQDRAHDVNEGSYSVMVPREFRYDLRVPATATDTARVPLLVWLADDGDDAQDVLALWRARLGDACAIAVVEPPYRETQEDLVEGGRWFWNDTFRQDVVAVRDGIVNSWAYLLRNQPIDPDRVVIAGEGTGATIVAATTMLSEDVPVRAVALAPARFSQVKDFPLPLPELRGDAKPAKRSLDVLVRPGDADWWKGELAEYASVGLLNTLATRTDDPWAGELEVENRVRAALGLAARDLPASAARRHVIVDGPRARAWARRLVAQRAQEGERVALFDSAADAARASGGVDTTKVASASNEIPLRVRAEDYRHGGSSLPRAVGPFGGTTVIVLPDGLETAQVEAWTALAADDPLNKTSRFHRMVLATMSGERALPVVLGELAAKNRKNVLIVPAVWCADGGTMRALKNGARAYDDTMSLSYRPGLGGLTSN